jgi:uncharacterized protein Smg (DUF494 family)
MMKKDYVKEIGDYIRKNLKKGYTKESLKWALVSQGHSRMEVEKAISLVDEELAEEAPLLKTKPVITYEAEPVSMPIVEEKKSWFSRIFGF